MSDTGLSAEYFIVSVTAVDVVWDARAWHRSRRGLCLIDRA